MTRWKLATIILLLAMFVLGFAWWRTHAELAESQEIIDKYAAAELERQNFVPGEFEKPKIPDAPAGTTPILTATGRTRHPPTPGAARQDQSIPGLPNSDRPLPAPGGSPAPDVPRATCSLDDVDVTFDCIVEALATPTRPWARLTTSGTLKAWGQTRDLPPTPAGEVKLAMAPSVALPRWHLNFLGGVAAGQRFGVEAGFAWSGKSRLGFYTMAEWQPPVGGEAYSSSTESYVSTGDPSAIRVHAGLNIRLK